ncbi:hypothetical protein Poly30_44480 [Planctomycetes bacterium Poly30]|uniref:Secreted protein n=1 Tax=Saltatorellus ferox TaxID=2528018 RepID=A0A518EXT9_9BACT|nr:hypothetical protein Poly30_44480 [Planctomycetes bacterium Poly30]
MTRIKIALAALAVPFLMASCVTDRSQESAETMEVSTDEVVEELDPNDPDVMQCPVTGALQRRSDTDGSTHGDGVDM